jgi:hypothetical protein
VRFKIDRSTMSGVHSSPILHSCGGCSPIGGCRSPEDFEVVNSSEIPTILRLPTLNLQNPAFLAWCASCIVSL